MNFNHRKRPNPVMYIYHIHDTEGRVVYVGISCDVQRRLACHISVAREYMATGMQSSPFIHWVADELRAGRGLKGWIVRPAGEDYREAERRQIIRLLARGEPLLNVVCKGLFRGKHNPRLKYTRKQLREMAKALREPGASRSRLTSEGRRGEHRPRC